MASDPKDDEALTTTAYIKDTISNYINGFFEEGDNCCQCASGQEMYCVECDKVFCKPCGIRAHHPGTNIDAHSLEEVEGESDQGVQIITPLLEEVLLCSVLLFVFKHTLIDKDYLHSGDVCILTTYVRKAVAMLDDKAFYVVKAPLATYCNIEDSYWRLFLDFWVRDVVTDSDSLFLLGISFLSAWLFKGAVVIVFVPILATIYGITFATISKAEALLPSSFGPLKLLQRIVKRLNVVDFIVADAGDCPPATKRRLRPPMNYVDFLWYEQNRIFRGFTHFFGATGTVLEKMLTLPMYAVVAVRAFCISFSLGPGLHNIFALVLPDTLATHSAWFQGISSDEYTDRFVSLVARSLVGLGVQAEGRMGFVAFTSLSAITSRYLFLPLAVVGTLVFRYYFETWKFATKWQQGGLREKVRGPCQMGSECKCDCVQHVCGKLS